MARICVVLRIFFVVLRKIFSMEKIISLAKEIQPELVQIRRFLHENAEVGFQLSKTLAFVEENLRKMGYQPRRCGKSGIVATLFPKNEKDKNE